MSVSVQPESPVLQWIVDPEHTQIHFRIRHRQITVIHGDFRRFEITMTATPPTFADAEIRAELDVASLTTHHIDRDEALRQPAFFDLANHPRITFRSTALMPIDDERFRLRGNLEIKGRTLPLDLEVEYGGMLTDFEGLRRVGFSIETQLNRFDLGLDWNERMPDGQPEVGETVQIEIEVELTETPPETSGA